MSQPSRTWGWMGLGAIALLALMLLSLLAAPHTGPLQQGSTYSRAPSGYGAWYAYMQQQGVVIQRWQQPLEQLFKLPQPSVGTVSSRFALSQAAPGAITLLQISPRLSWLSPVEEDWVKQGNVLIQLGVSPPATPAPFRSRLESRLGGVKVETSRRYTRPSPTEKPAANTLLGDAFGAVVWQVPLGQGRVIYASTAYLGANAYQQEPGNFAWLAQLVTGFDRPIVVNEYLHGYKDAATRAQERAGSVIGYLMKTPLVVIAVQAGVMLLVLVWGQNQRLGPPVAIAPPKQDNSQAYIQALAGVLRQANSTPFVVETVRKAELAAVQRSLGLAPHAPPTELVAAWMQQTGRSASDLDPLLMPTPDRFRERELLIWLETIRLVRQHLPS